MDGGMSGLVGEWLCVCITLGTLLCLYKSSQVHYLIFVRQSHSMLGNYMEQLIKVFGVTVISKCD